MFQSNSNSRSSGKKQIILGQNAKERKKVLSSQAKFQEQSSKHVIKEDNNSSKKCEICEDKLAVLCVFCHMKKDGPCMVSVGRCGHAFHSHCLQNLLMTKCITCKKDWELSRTERR